MEDLAQTFEYLKQFLTEERLSKIEHFSKESSDFILPVMDEMQLPL
jgi:tRNA (guanosine-2'-O-)-methyltransferase